MALPPQHDVEVGDGLVAVVQDHGELGVSNAAFAVEAGEALVVDTMLLPEMADGIVHALERRGARPRLVLNTHHHLDHVGGNARLAAIPAVAHPVTAALVAGMAADLQPVAAVLPRFTAQISGLTVRLPTAVDPGAVPVPGGGRILTFAPAHTPADLAVWFPAARVLFAGDLCGHGVTPLAVHASVPDWLEAVETLLGLRPVTVVPGHGGVGTAEDLEAVAIYFRALLEVGRKATAAGVGVDEALAAVDPGPVGGWREPGRTRLNLARVLATPAPSPAGEGSPRPAPRAADEVGAARGGG